MISALARKSFRRYPSLSGLGVGLMIETTALAFSTAQNAMTASTELPANTTMRSPRLTPRRLSAVAMAFACRSSSA